MLKIQHITAAYHKGHPILEDVNLELAAGERIAILGRNGAGKTSFANCVFGLVPLISGKIVLPGTRAEPHASQQDKGVRAELFHAGGSSISANFGEAEPDFCCRL